MKNNMNQKDELDDLFSSLGNCTICGKELYSLTCSNKWCGEVHYECSKCHKVLNGSQTYEYRGFNFCTEHFDEGQELVNHKRAEAIEASNSAIRNQANGEWHNGGYKYMKTDIGGSPIPSNVKEPQVLKDYENGIL